MLVIALFVLDRGTRGPKVSQDPLSILSHQRIITDEVTRWASSVITFLHYVMQHYIVKLRFIWHTLSSQVTYNKCIPMVLQNASQIRHSFLEGFP